MRHFLSITIITVLPLFACTSSVESVTDDDPEKYEQAVELDNYFAGIDPDDATFVIYHPATNHFIRHNPARASQRFIPASTYKIPNALIALDTGVADSAEHRIPWNGTAAEGFWSPTWSKDHTLRSAFKHSVYWYYQSLAREIGAERMQAYLGQFHYGNRSIAGGVDQFWLHGGLRISADEQVQFLARMYNGELDISPQSVAIVKDLMILEDKPTYRLGGKTGTADVTPTHELAWLVGYVERNNDVWLYALNMEGEEVWERWGKPSARIALVRDLLQELQVIPLKE
ncbi:penicillin-binding transpeptidase domain-containing protein [Cellvibrio sp. ARAG 10.3]|uniref:penicillin-binding transpeptidase domain-containing protein n=1 Tax=Cellvibrio sp. ARAG 10.3 TaxID=3451358 RepID=UPI003F4502B7